MMATEVDTGRTKMTKKRRASKLDDSDDSTGKRRGRPRVEKPDESAADRRRTQIRMAQRAYRQRKESTLDELRQQVTQLSDIVKTMNTAFKDCRDALVTHGLPESSHSKLRQTSIQFAEMLKIIGETEDVEADEPEVLARRSPVSYEDSSETAADLPAAQNVFTWLDKTEMARPRRVRTEDYLGMGYSVVLPEDAETTALDQVRTNSSKPGSVYKTGATDLQDLFKVQSIMAPAPSLHPGPLVLPTTYSFHETSFARRLHRSCLEESYAFLLDPGRAPKVYDRVFKLPLLLKSQAEMIANVKAVMDRGVGEPLDLYDSPLIHIGGAGTHYPRPDKFGNMQSKKAAYHLGMIGPQTLALLDRAGQQGLTADVNVEISGYEGEWFDPYDVEGYLKEKGIVIDPSSSFAEIDMSESGQTMDSNTTSSFSSPATPPLKFSADALATTWTYDAFKPVADVPIGDDLQWNDFSGFHTTDLGNVGYTDASTGSWMNLDQADNSLVRFKSREALKPTVFLDVAKFLKALKHGGVCLGRIPGFRRKDVDQALSLSTFDPLSFDERV